MAAALLGATAFVSSIVTKASVTQDLLGNQLADTNTELKQTQAELIATRSAQAVATSKLADAAAAADKQRDTELAHVAAPTITAVTNTAPQSSAPPATRPSVMDRVVSLFGN